VEGEGAMLSVSCRGCVAQGWERGRFGEGGGVCKGDDGLGDSLLFEEGFCAATKGLLTHP